MSSELEHQLEDLLAAAPEPEPGVGEDALARALSALQPVAAPRRGLRTAVLVFATALVLLAIAAGSLAAAGALHVTFGAKAEQRPAVTQLSLPQGANGIAAIVDGRLSVVIKGGFRLQGLPASAAALSPHALYVAAGIGSSLVAMAPDGRRAWSHPAGGTVVAIAWAPDGLRIAYVVRHGHRFALRVIYGNGTHDTAIDRSVRPVRPSWRSDSLAFAYVGAGGRAIVYDVGHQRRGIVSVSGAVAGVSFAPIGSRLAVDTGEGVWLTRGSRAVRVTPRAIEAFGWQNDSRLAVAVPSPVGTVLELFSPDGAPRGSDAVPGAVVAVARKLLVVRRGDELSARDATVLTIPRGSVVTDVEIR